MNTEKIRAKLQSIAKDVAVIEKLLSESDPVFPADRLQLVKENKCVRCGKDLGEEKPERGCHEKCYRGLMRSIQSNEITEYDLITAGFLLPPQRGGRKRKHDVASEVKRIKAEKDSLHASPRKKKSTS